MYIQFRKKWGEEYFNIYYRNCDSQELLSVNFMDGIFSQPVNYAPALELSLNIIFTNTRYYCCASMHMSHTWISYYIFSHTIYSLTWRKLPTLNIVAYISFKFIWSGEAQFVMPYHTIPYHTVPYHIVLYCTALHCTVLYYTVLYCTLVYCTIPYHTVP